MNSLACSASWNSLPPLYGTLLTEQNLICFHSQLLKGTLSELLWFKQPYWLWHVQQPLETTHKHTEDTCVNSSNKTDWFCPCFQLSRDHRVTTENHRAWKSAEGRVGASRLGHYTQPFQRPTNVAWWRLLISMSPIRQHKLLLFLLIKQFDDSTLAAAETIFGTRKSSSSLI